MVQLHLRLLMAAVASLMLAGAALAIPPGPGVPRAVTPRRDMVRNLYLEGQPAPRSRAGVRQVGSWVPTSGTVRLLAIPVQFSKDTDPNSSGTGQFPYASWGPATEPDYLKTRLEQVTDYFTEVSAPSGHPVTVVSTLTEVVTLNKPMSEYTSSMDFNTLQFMTDVIAAGDAKINFAPADIIMLIHAGCGQEMTGYSADIWSHSASLISGALATADGVEITAWTVMPETECGDYFLKQANPSLDIQAYEAKPSDFPGVVIPRYWDVLGVFVHELGHAFGMPDVYDTEYDDGVSLGDWSLMASGSYLPVPPTGALPWTIPHAEGETYFSSVPSHPDAWNKQLMGWADVRNVTTRLKNEVVPPCATSGRVYRLWTRGNASGTEYFLAENRAKVGYDRFLPEAGLMVYHIDDTIGSLSMNDVQTGRYLHPRIMPESADNVLETRVYADGSVVYEPRLNTPFPSALNNTRFGSKTTPSSYAYSGASSLVDMNNISISGNNVLVDFRTTPGLDFVQPRDGETIYVCAPTLIINAPTIIRETVEVRINNIPISNPAAYYDATAKRFAIPLDSTTVGPLAPGVYTVVASGTEIGETSPLSETMRFTVEAKMIRRGLRMISLPVTLIPKYGETQHIFALLGGTQTLAWYDANLSTNGNPGGYRYYTDNELAYDPIVGPIPAWASSVAVSTPNGLDLPPAGLGFWSRLSADCPLTLEGDMVDGTTPYTIALRKGFNLIGNPYAYPIAMAGMSILARGKTYSIQQAAQLSLITPNLYTWQNNDAQGTPSHYVVQDAVSGVMKPWVGYWIYAFEPVQLRLAPLPVSEVRALEPQATRAAGALGQWSVVVKATGTAQDTESTVTVGTGQRSETVYAPPMAPSSVQIASLATADGPGLLRDVRAAVADSAVTWTLTVNADPGSRIVLNWPDLTGLPRNYTAVLRDEITGDERYLRTCSSYGLMLGADESQRRLTLTVTPGRSGGVHFTGVTARRNRAGGQTAITCQLTQAARVTAEIRTISGRVVRTLETTTAGDDTATLMWDGQDADGRILPGGVMYQCQLTARTENGQLVRTVVLINR